MTEPNRELNPHTYLLSKLTNARAMADNLMKCPANEQNLSTCIHCGLVTGPNRTIASGMLRFCPNNADGHVFKLENFREVRDDRDKP